MLYFSFQFNLLTIGILFGGNEMVWTSEVLLQATDEQFIQLFRQHEESFREEIIKHLQIVQAAERERLAVQPFFRLLQLQVLSDEEKQQFYEVFVSNAGLFYEEGEHAVITRATTAFIVSQLIPQLASLDDFTAVVCYLRYEHDGRGQISESIGWSDAIGSAVDLAIAAIVHPNFHASQYVELLQAIRSSIWTVSSYTNNEEERFAKLIVMLLQKGLPEDALIEWVEQLVDKLEYYAHDLGHDLKWFQARTNTMALLRALYFACKFSGQNKKVEAIISFFIQKYML